MITHLLYQLLDSFKIGSPGFRKILSITISIMLFVLLFAAVRFTQIEVPQFNRNLLLLALVDLGGFFFITWKQNKTYKNKDNETQKENTTPTNTQIPQTPEKITHEPTKNLPIQQINTNSIENVPKQEQYEEEVTRIMNEIIKDNKEKINSMETEMNESNAQKLQL